MAKYQQYEEYKESGVEWLGEVPSHWELSSLKRCVDGCTNGIWGSEPEDDSDNTIVLRVADFDRNKLEISEEKLTLRNISPQESENRSLKKGDLLIEKSGGGDRTLVGCVVLFDKDFKAVTSNFVAKMTPKIKYESRFLKYAFSLLYDGRVNYASIKQTTGIQNLDSDAYLMENFVFPVKFEQAQIANFLDFETAQIDTLIDKQQTLIQLLKEKRQAVISHSVTKGLNPDVSMKDSGVEWLGEVPEHWVVASLRRIISRMEQGKSPQCESSSAKIDEWGVLKTSCVNGGRFQEEENKLLPSHITPHEEYEVKAGDLLMSRASGSINLIGSVVLVQENVRAKLLLSDKVFRIYLNKDYDSLFFSYLMSSSYMRSSIEIAISGAEGMANNIAKSSIMEFVIPILPLDEQVVIASHLQETETQYVSLISKAEQAIQLMQERRTALISAAVTGKIDVRGWVAPDSEAL